MDVNGQSQWDFEISLIVWLLIFFLRAHGRVALSDLMLVWRTQKISGQRSELMFCFLLEVEELDGEREDIAQFLSFRERPMVLSTGILKWSFGRNVESSTCYTNLKQHITHNTNGFIHFRVSSAAASINLCMRIGFFFGGMADCGASIRKGQEHSCCLLWWNH